MLSAGLALFVAGCGADRPSAPPAVRVTVRDFAIDAPASVRAGAVLLAVHNRGPSTHEVLVVKAPNPALPLRRDGITIDEDALEDAEAGEIEGTHPGRTRSQTFHLSPGRYELVC